MELKKYLKKVVPDRGVIQKLDSLKLISGILHDPNIFHLTKRSVAGGIATGLFISFFPVPGHMLIAAILAILFRVNLPLAVVSVWVTNPLTMTPIFYLEYRLGSFLLDRPTRNVDFEMSLSWFRSTFMEIWPALFTGAFVLALAAAIISYGLIRLLWRLAVIQKWERRKMSRVTNEDSFSE